MESKYNRMFQITFIIPSICYPHQQGMSFLDISSMYNQNIYVTNYSNIIRAKECIQLESFNTGLEGVRNVAGASLTRLLH